MVGGEGNGHHHHVLPTSLGQGLDHLVCLRTKPWQWTNLYTADGERERESKSSVDAV